MFYLHILTNYEPEFVRQLLRYNIIFFQNRYNCDYFLIFFNIKSFNYKFFYNFFDMIFIYRKTIII